MLKLKSFVTVLALALALTSCDWLERKNAPKLGEFPQTENEAISEMALQSKTAFEVFYNNRTDEIDNSPSSLKYSYDKANLTLVDNEWRSKAEIQWSQISAPLAGDRDVAKYAGFLTIYQDRSKNTRVEFVPTACNKAAAYFDPSYTRTLDLLPE